VLVAERHILRLPRPADEDGEVDSWAGIKKETTKHFTVGSPYFVSSSAIFMYRLTRWAHVAWYAVTHILRLHWMHAPLCLHTKRPQRAARLSDGTNDCFGQTHSNSHIHSP
jgi:hypothetical protein